MKKIIYCGHPGCANVAKEIVANERPNHSYFLGQAHDCCGRHGRA